MKTDLAWMEHALALGEMARLLSPPNPWVGCVIVKGAKMVGSGYTQPPGQQHAEKIALSIAGDNAKGATLYVTLEPCTHWGRTPPCVDAIIAAGIARVVIALSDPDIRVAGNGIKLLQLAGIEVDVGIGEDVALRSLQAYLYQRKNDLPFCVLKTATSIDGKIAAQDGSSQWITSPEARLDGHRYRAYSQAIAVGAGTACRDNPQLTVRHPSLHPHTPPLRVVFDSSGRTPASGALFDGKAPTLIFTTDRVSTEQTDRWRHAGASVEVVPSTSNGKIDLAAALRILSQRGVLQLLIEGGAELHSSFLEQGLAQQLLCYTGNTLLGIAGYSCYHGASPTNISKAPRLQLQETYPLGNSVCMVWQLQSNID
jgi:diaminohydroxyphosphoribosylaminopyrimidine deaminase/5-amino-6-(5-phosphoribosylamino)uracil reductase